MDGNEMEDNDRVDQPSKRQLNQGMNLFNIFRKFFQYSIIKYSEIFQKKYVLVLQRKSK